jgi:hypothetical protein
MHWLNCLEPWRGHQAETSLLPVANAHHGRGLASQPIPLCASSATRCEWSPLVVSDVSLGSLGYE